MKLKVNESVKNVLPRRGFNTKETAEIIGTSRRSLERLRARGLIKPSLALRTPIYSMEEIERFLRDTM